MRRTSPLCKCGRRARQCTVGSPGPNAGRSFFACPKGRKSGCKYFVWDDASQASSPVSTRPRVRVRDVNVLSPDVVVTKIVTEEDSLVDSCSTTVEESGTKEEENTVSVCSTAVAGSLSPPSSTLKSKKQYFGNVRIFNASKSLKCQRL